MKPKDKLQFNHLNWFYILSFSATILPSSKNKYFHFLLVVLQCMKQYSGTYFESIFTFQTLYCFFRLPAALAET